MSIGGSKSSQQSQQTSASTSASNQFSQASSTERIAFEDIFKQLYSGATGAAQTAAANAGQLGQTAQQLFTGGLGFLEGLGGDAGTEYLTERLTGPDDVLSQQLDVLREQSGRLFTEELNPAIVSQAAAGGTLGGGRQGVLQSQAMGEAATAFTQGATSLIAQNQTAKDTAAANVLQGSLQAASTGLGGLQGLFDLTQSGSNAELNTYSLLSSILGGPTTLTDSSSTSIARAFSNATSQGTSSGRSFGFNFGLTGGQ